MKKLFFLFLIVFQMNTGSISANDQFVITDTIQSEFLNENRVIHVYLPIDYYHSNDAYPLQVVLGSYSRTRMFYSIADYLSKSYHMVELNQLHTIPESIVVGVTVPNVDNMTEYNKFIVQEVVPFVEKKYRKCHYKSIIGHSRSGEFVLRSLFDKNSPFHAFYCSAPANSEYFIGELKKDDVVSQLKNSQKRLFLAASEQDYFYDGNKKLIEALAEIKTPAFSFESIIKKTDTHHTIFPVSITDALFFMYRDWYYCLPKDELSNTTESFMEHYETLSQTTGLKINPPEFDFYLLAYILNEKKLLQEKVELLKKCIGLYPRASNAHAYLAMTYYTWGDIENAKIFNEQALLLDPQNAFAKQTKALIEKKD